MTGRSVTEMAERLHIVCSLRRDQIGDVLVSTVDRFSTTYVQFADDHPRMIRMGLAMSRALGRYETAILGVRGVELSWPAHTWQQAVRNHEAALLIAAILDQDPGFAATLARLDA